jgi:hypothetical protein
MEKTITIDPDSGAVTVEQHEVHEGIGVSSDGFKINTGKMMRRLKNKVTHLISQKIKNQTGKN